MDFLDFRYKHHMDRAEAILRDTDELAINSTREDATEKVRENAQAHLAIDGPGMMQLAALHMQRATELREAHHAVSNTEATIAAAQAVVDQTELLGEQIEMNRHAFHIRGQQ